MSKPEHDTSPSMGEELRPTQDQLRALRDLIFKYEPDIEPFSDLPSQEVLEKFNTSLENFETLTAPTTYNERIAPAQTLRTPDKRVIWLSVFRNPDTNEVVRQHIMIIDSPANLRERPEIPREDYDLYETSHGQFSILNIEGGAMTFDEVNALHKLIETSEVFNPFS